MLDTTSASNLSKEQLWGALLDSHEKLLTDLESLGFCRDELEVSMDYVSRYGCRKSYIMGVRHVDDMRQRSVAKAPCELCYNEGYSRGLVDAEAYT